MPDDVVGKKHPLSQEGWTIFSINTTEENKKSDKRIPIRYLIRK